MTVACILATGRPAYGFAARQAVRALLDHTEFDIVVGCDQVGSLLLPRHPRLRTVEIASHAPRNEGDRFLAKFILLEKVLNATKDQYVLLVDSDAILVRPIGDADLSEALNEKMIGMAVQPGTVPDRMTHEHLYRHYRDVTFAALGAGKTPAPLEHFRCYNSGVALFRREGLTTLLDWYRRQPKLAAFGNRMIADQDYLQVFANEIIPRETAQLPGVFNHSPLWHEDYPREDAVFRHFSNYCHGPDTAALRQMLELNRATGPRVVSPATKGAPGTSVTIVVVTYNSAQTLPLCLDLLSDHCCQIIVVDNGSSDGSSEIAAKAGARVVRNDANLGFARACNIGAAAANGEILCFLNPDCLLDEETLSTAVAQIERNARALYIPQFVEWPGNTVKGRQPGYTRMKLVADVLENTRLRKVARWLRRKPTIDDLSWHWPLAACLFVHGDTFRGIGGFDESFWLYMEDVRLGEDAARRGIPTVDLGRTVVHFGSMGSSTRGSARHEILVSGRLRYAERAYGKVFAKLLALVYAATRRGRGARA